MPKTETAVKAPTKAELKADALALVEKIKTVPNFDKNADLLYALREANNCASLLGK